MIRHLHSVICDHVVESPNGRISYWGLRDVIRTTRVPGVPLAGVVVSRLLCQGGEVFEVRITSHRYDWIASLIRLVLPAAPERGLVITALLTDVTFPALGDYEVLIVEEDRPIHSLPLEVKLEKAALHPAIQTREQQKWGEGEGEKG